MTPYLPTRRRSIRPWGLAAAAVAVLATASLAACDRSPQEPTVGQRLDTTVARVEQKVEALTSDVKAGASEVAGTVRAEATQAAFTTEQAMKDAAITAAVNARLASDRSLSALRIEVDTERGHVTLHGEAPSGEARNRASALASSVDGVTTVDNRLIDRSSK